MSATMPATRDVDGSFIGRQDATDSPCQVVVQALDALNLAVLATDASGQLLLANRPARQILRVRDGLQLTNYGTLETSRPAARSSLLQWISSVGLFPASGMSPWTSPILVLKRPLGRRPLTVAVRSVRAVPDVDAGMASALIFAVDPERTLGATEAALRQLHGMTAQEARLANLLMAGNTIEECCADLNIQTSTARMHLGSLFAKTGAQRQSQLVSLLLGSVGVFRSTVATIGEPLSDGVVSGLPHAVNKTRGAVAAALEALEHLEVGVAALDDSRQLCFATPLARRLLEECDDLEAAAGGLNTPEGFRTSRWDSLLPQRERNLKKKHPAWDALLPLPRKPGKRPLTIMARRVAADASTHPGAAYLLFILDPERPMQVAEEGLRLLYGVTRAEARLASLLMQGNSLDACCAQLQIRSSTARMHLSNLFAKTGVQRQGPLISLLVRTLGLLPGSEPADPPQEEKSNHGSEVSWTASMTVRERAEGGI